MQAKYARAYTEVLELLKRLPKEEYSIIPEEKINFFEANKDQNYYFYFNPNADLKEQNISKEANAIIIALFKEYFATDSQKSKLNDILLKNQKKIDEKNKYVATANTFPQASTTDDTKIENEENKQLVLKKESFFQKLGNFILKLFHKNK